MRGAYENEIDISTSPYIVHEILAGDLYSFFVNLFLQGSLCTTSVRLKLNGADSEPHCCSCLLERVAEGCVEAKSFSTGVRDATKTSADEVKYHTS